MEATGDQGVDAPSGGLSSDEARARLEKSGPNEMPDTTMRPWRMALAKFWAPVPWMLEAAVVLQLVLHEYVEAAVIAVSARLQRRARVLAGGARAGHARRPEVAPGAHGLGATRRCLEEHPRERAGAGGHGEALARRRGGGRRQARRRVGPARSVDAHGRIRPHRSRAGYANLRGGAGAARRGHGASSPQPVRARSSVTRPSWSAPPTW